MEGKTNVQITVETRDRLLAHGAKGDTYEDVIKRLLDHLDDDLNRLEAKRDEKTKLCV